MWRVASREWRAANLVLAAALLVPGQDLKFSTNTNLVVVNVSVKDKSGKPIAGLKKEDFIVFEDDKLQSFTVFEEQKLSSEPLPAFKEAPNTAEDRVAVPEWARGVAASKRFQDKRMIGLLFDFSSMPVPDQLRAQKAAVDFLQKNMTAADVVSIMTFSSQFKVVQEFTDDRAALIDTIKKFRIGEASELAAEGSTLDPDDDSGSNAFTADESEFNIFNTDRKLTALETAARRLGGFPEKKALVYFASGVSQTGTENQAQLRATVNAAIRANVSFYPVDARGLVPTLPGGDATTSGAKGSGLFSGRSQTQARSKFNDSQETLYTLAADTGGKALLDSNDLSLGIQQVQKDVESYYTLGYYSSNDARDGKYRRIKVRLKELQAKLDYRTGYYAEKDWQKFNSSDKERQLEEALATGDPVSELPLAVEVDWFRVGKNNYFVPVVAKIPGTAVGLGGKSGKRTAELDFIGQVRDSKGKLVSAVRDGITVKLDDSNAAEWTKRHLQYDTGLTLAPGDYTLRFLARENQTGKMGTFETKFTVPDISGEGKWARLSSVVWAGQRQPVTAAVGSAENNKKATANHPLVQDGQKLVPSVTRVFRRNQTLYVYFEVYDPTADPDTKAPDLSASLTMFQGARKVFESTPVRTTSLVAHRSNTAAFQIQLPLSSLQSARYLAQVSVIDHLGRKFAFSRSDLVIAP